MSLAIARLSVVAAAIAGAAWVLPGSVHIVNWPSAGAVVQGFSAADPSTGATISRVAFVPPLSRLWVVAFAAATLVAACAYAWRATGRSLDDLARAASPLMLLLLWLVPFVPWICDVAPTLVVFAGPLRWAVAATAIAGIVDRMWRSPLPRPHIQRRAVLITAFLVYAALGVRFVNQVGYGGDEPHYLVITHSLLADHDLDISNNHERQDYGAFYGGTLRPDFLQRGRHGEIYSIHAPGLPALLVPAYAIGGALGCVVFVAALAALASLAIFDLAVIVAGPGAAFATWLGTCFSVPFIPHAYLIYPEVAGATIVAWAVLWLWRPPVSVGRTAAHGLALAILPWLHTKFVVFLALLTLFELIRLWPRIRHIAALLAPIAISGAAWLLSFYWMYGVFDPEAPYGTYTQMFVLAKNIPRGTLGLLFDQKFGLLVYSPLYLVAIAGGWLLVRDTRQRARVIGVVLAAVVFFVSTTRLYMWWGGSSAPARFLVPIVPLLAPLVAIAIARLDRALGRALVLSTLVATLSISAVTIGSTGEGLLYSSPHGVASMIQAIQGPAPLDLLLPTFTEENWRAPIAALLPWLISATLSISLLALCVRAGVVQRAYSAIVAGGLVFLIAAGVLTSRPSAAIRNAAADVGRHALLQDFDPSRLRAMDAGRFAPLSNDDVVALGRIQLRRGDGGNANQFGTVGLPEGQYDAEIWFDGHLAHEGDARIVASDSAVLATVTGPLANPTRVRFDLTIPAAIALVLTDDSASDAVRKVEISAVSVTGRSHRIAQRTVAVESIEESAARGGLIGYTDDFAYAEDGTFWTRGTHRSTVAITTAGASTLRLILHVGPPGSTVELSVDGHRQQLEMRPNETRDVDIALPSITTRVAVSIRASRAFVPAEVETGNFDRRSLGCQVRPVLFWAPPSK